MKDELICNQKLYFFAGVKLTEGQKVGAVVLHVDMLSACVHVSILSKVMGKKKSVSVYIYIYIFFLN